MRSPISPVRPRRNCQFSGPIGERRGTPPDKQDASVSAVPPDTAVVTKRPPNFASTDEPIRGREAVNCERLSVSLGAEVKMGLNEIVLFGSIRRQCLGDTPAALCGAGGCLCTQ